MSLKRLLDMSISVSALLVISPVLLATALLVRLGVGRPVLFSHVRVGVGERRFQMFKFRTMRNAVDHNGSLLPDSERLTGIGRFLRSTSLDELPEFWNVLKGDMSLVGPRPLLPEYLDRYTECQRRRHEVKPGITGWAQINGRNGLSWEQKFELDVWYVNHASLALDLKILFRTLLTEIKRDGISQRGHATMPEFLGTTNTGVSLPRNLHRPQYHHISPER
jgi:lipopolysaccharide/colanic/teichoic acid biosynthesis glycosyltransferase